MGHVPLDFQLFIFQVTSESHKLWHIGLHMVAYPVKNKRIIFRIFWDISCAVHCHCLNVHERHDIFVCHP